ncbi:hypothetical protein L6452_42145 [Arctium lappa]|uniref:Uncharacterized protein n=1 Tax=Arctium lappa TaxID=4217 RepID=A0ACB8XHF2_ARCLA|nr:hypothetical protein L6452_42145 [Arctium lappa]
MDSVCCSAMDFRKASMMDSSSGSTMDSPSGSAMGSPMFLRGEMQFQTKDNQSSYKLALSALIPIPPSNQKPLNQNQ